MPLAASNAASVCAHKLKISINDSAPLPELPMRQGKGKNRAKLERELLGAFVMVER